MRSGLFLTLLLSGAAVIPMLCTAQDEPSYQGQPFSYWFEHSFDNPTADAAFKSMGSNAVPFLIRIVEKQPSALGKVTDRGILNYEAEHGKTIPEAVRDTLPSAFRTETYRENAVYLIGQLGPVAASAIPVLLKVFEDQNEDWHMETEVRAALLSMRESGAIAVPHYTDYLTGNDNSQIVGANLLASVGPKAQPAVPLLLEVVKSSNGQVRWAAARALWCVDRQTNIALRVFLIGLESGNETRRQIALIELRQMGPAAKDAEGAIQAALTDPEDQVRLETEKALREIDPSLLDSNLHQMNANPAAAMDKLIQQLENADAIERYRVLEAIGVFGANAKPAVPALIETLNGSGPRFPTPFAVIGLANSQREAARVLAEIGPEARAAVPSLISLVKEHFQYEAECIKALGRIGPDAHDAIPLLQEALTNEERGVRLVAADALTRIAPDNCSNAIAVLKELQYLPKLSKIWLVDSNGDVNPMSVTNFEDPAASYFYAAASVPLWKLGLEKEPPVNVIIDDMTKHPGSSNLGYIELLGDIGPEAKSALPLLEKMLSAPWSDVMGRPAAVAIRKIASAEADRLELPGLFAVP